MTAKGYRAATTPSCEHGQDPLPRSPSESLMLFRSVLLLAVGISAFGQGKFEALRTALGLTDSQMRELRKEPPAPIAPAPQGSASAGRRPGAFSGREAYPVTLQRALQNPILDAMQLAELAEIPKVLDRWRAASEAIVTGLISAQQWPGQTLCLYPIHANNSEFNLRDAQLQQLTRLQQAAREPLEAPIAEKEQARLDLLISGLRADSPAVVQAVADISKLRQQWSATVPPRDLARAVLDDAQKTQLEALEAALELVREAIELKLIPDPPKGEILCQ